MAQIAAKIQASLQSRSALWAGGVTILLLYLMSVLTGEWGLIGPDDDDVMRLAQIKDVLGGQGWFDTDQHRLGSGGTDMHWSRLVDLPYIIAARILDIFLPAEMALRWSISLVPPLFAGAMIAATAQATRNWNAPFIKPFALLLMGLFLLMQIRFQPGAIDHHNIQMVLIFAALAFALDPLRRFRNFAIAGVLTALAVAVGVEVYLFAAAICAYAALDWLIIGHVARRSASGFGLGLAGGLILAFFGTIASAEYGFVKCDSLSSVTVLAGGLGGLGLAGLSRAVSAKPWIWRLAGLAVLGGLVAALLFIQAPQCLSNPLAELPANVDRLWLSDVAEAQPLFSPRLDPFMDIPVKLGAPLLALGLVFWSGLKGRITGSFWGPPMLCALLLITAISLTIYQVRFANFAYLFAILPLAGWVDGIFAREGERAVVEPGRSRVKYIGALMLSLPVMWGMPGLLLGSSKSAAPKTAQTSIPAGGCYSKDVVSAMKALPIGLIAASSNGGAVIIGQTQHQSLSGNYHRNIAGIAAQIDIAISAPDQAYTLLKANNVDYLHFCKNTLETTQLAKENENSLFARMLEGDVPEYLAPLWQGDGRNAALYKVN